MINISKVGRGGLAHLGLALTIFLKWFVVSTLINRQKLKQIALVALLSVGLGMPLAQAQDDYLDPEDAFQIQAAMVDPQTLGIHFRIAPGYYMYRDRFQFELAPSNEWMGEVQFPPAEMKFDENFNEDMAIYHREVTLHVPLVAGALAPLTLSVQHQGCADAGLCYTPSFEEYTLKPTQDGYTLSSGPNIQSSVPAPLSEAPSAEPSDADISPPTGQPSANTSSSGFSFQDAFTPSSDTGLAAYLGEAGWLQIVALSFVLGLMLSFTPCVLPMVPILLGIIAGPATATSEHPQRSRGRGLALAAVYVLGVSVVYTVLGVVAGLVGASLTIWLQNPWVLSVFAVLLVVLALSMFDVYQLQVPSAIQSGLQGRLGRLSGGRFGGVFIMGMLSALIVGPCVAAPLAGVLLFISQTGNVWLGGSALFALAWGSGMLLLVVGATSGALMPKVGGWMNTVKHVFGLMLIATAWWMVNSFMPSVIFMLGWAVLGLWLALLLGAFRGAASTTEAPGVGQLFWRTLGYLAAIWAVLIVVGVASGSRSVLQPLDQLKGGGGSVATAVTAPTFERINSLQELDQRVANAQQPVMLDFYADWCVSCIEMEKFTFTDPTVAQQMEQMVLLQADVTEVTPEHRALLKRFQLFGPPGIIFFDAQGKELSQRVVGFQPADRFSEVLAQVLQ